MPNSLLDTPLPYQSYPKQHKQARVGVYQALLSSHTHPTTPPPRLRPQPLHLLLLLLDPSDPPLGPIPELGCP